MRFLKDKERNYHGNKGRTYYGKLAGAVGIVCNVLLCVAKFIAGIFVGSMSIMADAVNNLSDAASSAVSLIGFKFSEKRPDREHPYGHARYEYISGFVVAIIMIVIGAELMRDGIIRILNPEVLLLTAFTVVTMIVSVIVKICMAVFDTCLAKKIDSDTLLLAAKDSRNDCITTLVVLVAAALSHFFTLPLDGPMTVFVALFILVDGIKSAAYELSPLIGMAPTKEFSDDVKKKILSYPGVLNAHDLIVHDYGHGRKFATVHVEMAAEQDVIESHRVIDDMEYYFLHSDGIHLLVHFDPIVTDKNSPCDERGKIEKTVQLVDKRLTVHDLRVVECGSIKKAYFDVACPKEFNLDEEELRREICRYVRRIRPDYTCVITFDDEFASIPSIGDL